MATLSETKVAADIQLVLEPDGSRKCILNGFTLSAADEHLRTFPAQDVYPVLDAALKAHVDALISAADQYLKTIYEIA